MLVTQDQAFGLCINPKNKFIFLTGPGGTGKSFLINRLTEHFNKLETRFRLTATTGMASDLICGETIHSLTKCVFDMNESDYLKDLMENFKNACRSEYYRKQAKEKFWFNDIPKFIENTVKRITSNNYFWRKVAPTLKTLEVLILDEVSMLGAIHSILISELLKKIRHSKEPFGGVKVIVSGDFFQLPPVNDYFFFVSHLFKECDFKFLVLYKNYRAKGEEWNQILSKIRNGDIDDSIVKFFQSRIKEPPKLECEIPYLVSTNKEADLINKQKYDAIPGPENVYRAKVVDEHNILEKYDLHRFYRSRLVKNELPIKIGLLVMVIVNDNINNEYVNGTCGKVVYADNKGVVIRTADGRNIDIGYHNFTVRSKEVKNPNYNQLDENGDVDFNETIKVEAKVRALPLIHAFALTSHKAQGQTYEYVILDLEKGFTEGQGYVAFSRCEKLEGVFLKSMPSPECLSVHPHVIRFLQIYEKEFTEYYQENPEDMCY